MNNEARAYARLHAARHECEEQQARSVKYLERASAKPEWSWHLFFPVLLGNIIGAALFTIWKAING